MSINRLFAALAFLSLVACGQPVVLPDNAVRLSDAFHGEFSLIDTNEKAVTQADFTGKVMLVYFGFTNCPDVCPGDVGIMSAALNRLGDNADKVAPIFISVDPERDTPEALRTYFAFDNRIIALTGDEKASEAARAGFKMFAQKQILPDSALGYTVDHGRFFYVSDNNAQPQYAIAGAATSEQLAQMLEYAIKNSD